PVAPRCKEPSYLSKTVVRLCIPVRRTVQGRFRGEQGSQVAYIRCLPPGQTGPRALVTPVSTSGLGLGLCPCKFLQARVRRLPCLVTTCLRARSRCTTAPFLIAVELGLPLRPRLVPGPSCRGLSCRRRSTRRGLSHESPHR